MKKIVVYFAQNVHRSELVAKAMMSGIVHGGGNAVLRASHTYRGKVEFDCAIFYGWAQGLRKVFEDYRKHASAIYIDLGYWGRRKSSRYDGYHKIVRNSRHPTDYFQRIQRPPDRFNHFGIEIQPWRKAGRHILVAGMSGKAAAAEGFNPHEWERRTIAELRKHTNRPIVYRAKPNWLDAKPIPGSEFSPRDVPIEQALRNCHAVIAHHSNVAIDALMAGIPCICPSGAASVLSGHDLSQVEHPPMPEGREQWAYDLSYTQYSLGEMQDGAAYRYLLSEGLI